MKKIFLSTLTLLIACATVKAQFGIMGGLNISKYKYTSDRKELMSFNAGIVYRQSLGGSLYVQPQLEYSVKGAVKYPDIDLGNDILKYTNRLSYAELSMPFIVSPDIDKDGIFKFDIGVGPYVANLLKATSTAETYEGDKSKADFKIGTTNSDDFKPIDAGLTIMAGTHLWNVNCIIQYDLGLVNVNPVQSAPPLKMRSFAFSAIIYFGGK